MPSKIVEGKLVDSYRFAGLAGKILQQAIPQQPQYDHIPWTPLTKPVSECRVALVTTAGISLQSDIPFDMERERQDPLWADQSFRSLPNWVTHKEVEVNHLHIETSYIYQDINVVLPVQRFQELAELDEVRELAPSCYSIMGYNIDPTELVCTSAPQIADSMRTEQVDVAFLVPV